MTPGARDGAILLDELAAPSRGGYTIKARFE